MGTFVVFEGLDGAGTTTQSKRLAEELGVSGRDIIWTREPSEGPVGKIIRTSLAGKEGAPEVSTLPWLFAADRADHLVRTVEPALARGALVVSDRYLHSSLAYQSLTHSLEAVLSLNQTFRLPDLTVFLDVPSEVCLARVEARLGGGAGREYYEERSRLAQVEAAYRKVLELQRSRGERILVIDGTLPVDEVFALVWEAVSTLG